MEIKMLEIRDKGTFIPVMCIRPVPENEGQGYLLRRDGYAGNESERCIIVVKAQCRGVSYDPYNWSDGSRTMRQAHQYIENNWRSLSDGDVVDVEWILNETKSIKISERHTTNEASS